MALITYHACDKCGDKRDKPHNVLEVVTTTRKPEAGQSVVTTTPFATIVRRQIELCDKCVVTLAEFVEKYLK